MLVASVGIGVKLRCMLKPYLVGNYSHSDKRKNKRPRCGGQGLLPSIEKSLPTRQVANTGRSRETATPCLGEADSARWALAGTGRNAMGPAPPRTQPTAEE